MGMVIVNPLLTGYMKPHMHSANFTIKMAQKTTLFSFSQHTSELQA